MKKHGKLPVYKHAEAFCLMWYACQCGHKERVWNSRDGVTPFSMPCPSCSEWSGLTHVDFHLDMRAPDHRPRIGQRVWISMTKDRAQALTQQRIESGIKGGHIDKERAEEVQSAVFDNYYQNGEAPDLLVWGYSKENHHD